MYGESKQKTKPWFLSQQISCRKLNTIHYGRSLPRLYKIKASQKSYAFQSGFNVSKSTYFYI